MKKKRSYQEEAERLAAAIDIAIEALQTECPVELDKHHQEQFISFYADMKQSCLNPEPQYRNLASLKFSINDTFIYFQEGTGKTVEYFWKKMAQTKLGYQRENRLEKILKRGKIRGRIEFDYVTDMLVVAEQTGMIDKNESKELSAMLGNYELKNK